MSDDVFAPADVSKDTPAKPEPVAVQAVNQGGVGNTEAADTPSEVKPTNAVSDVRSILAGSGERYGDGTPVAFAGFPMVKYHPVYGKREVNDPNEAHTIFQPPHDWFATPGEADVHRTEREAQQVVHYNQRVKVDGKVAFVNGSEPEADRKGIVRNSVQAQEGLDAGTERVI